MFNVDDIKTPEMLLEIKTTSGKAEAISAANIEYNNKVAMILQDTPKSEQVTWTKQEIEANAWTLDNNAYTPLLDEIAAARGISKELLVSKVLAKAEQYSLYIGRLIGERQYALREVE